MKKVIENVMFVIGLITFIAMLYCIVNYGTHSIKKVNEDAYHWRISWADRR